MPTPTKADLAKHARAEGGLDGILQTRVPGSVKKLVEDAAADMLISESAWLRRLLFQHFGLMPKTKRKAG